MGQEALLVLFHTEAFVSMSKPAAARGLQIEKAGVVVKEYSPAGKLESLCDKHLLTELT